MYYTSSYLKIVSNPTLHDSYGYELKYCYTGDLILIFQICFSDFFWIFLTVSVKTRKMKTIPRKQACVSVGVELQS